MHTFYHWQTAVLRSVECHETARVECESPTDVLESIDQDSSITSLDGARREGRIEVWGEYLGQEFRVVLQHRDPATAS